MNGQDDPGELPELQDALLAPAELDALFADLAAHTELLELLVKGGAVERARAARRDIGAAREALRSGAVAGLQVRYRFEGAEWCDTLLRQPGGVRLVRMQLPATPGD